MEQALWFAQTFGLKLSSVTFKDDSGKSHEMDYQTEDGRGTHYKDLSEEEREKVDLEQFKENSGHKIRIKNSGDGHK
ncbi:Hypothetical predicted protein [Paramuricea clavata]|uniref:Uncharacterized protein n=1 Tax=Paramuricea clavata TaxID=317549 RepID=A0A6S7HC91_PARCT|nr:Hypothetical predicted protein [Paramuricea clavata]